MKCIILAGIFISEEIFVFFLLQQSFTTKYATQMSSNRTLILVVEKQPSVKTAGGVLMQAQQDPTLSKSQIYKWAALVEREELYPLFFANDWLVSGHMTQCGPMRLKERLLGVPSTVAKEPQETTLCPSVRKLSCADGRPRAAAAILFPAQG